MKAKRADKARVQPVVMSFNYIKFKDMATKIVLSAFYEYANPIDIFNSTADEINGRIGKAIHNYQNDPMTKARVDNIVAILCHNINNCFDL